MERLAFTLDTTPLQTLTRPLPFDPDTESNLRSMSRPLSKCPERVAPNALIGGGTPDWRDDGNLSRNFLPQGHIGTCVETRSQSIAFPRMASEYIPCRVRVLEPWYAKREGAPTRLEARDMWSQRCGTGVRFDDA